MNFNFGEVLSRAGQITWKYKKLWLAGIVLGFVRFLPALITLPFNSSWVPIADPAEIERRLPAIFLMYGVTILFGILTIPVYVIGMSIPALGTLRLEAGNESLNLGELVRGVLPYFWRVLGIFLLIGAGVIALMLAFMACNIVLSIVTFGFGALCIVPIFIPLAILIFALMEQGMAAVLVDNLGVTSALQRAWELIKKNLGVMALLSIIIYLGAMVIGMIISVPMMIPIFGFMTSMMQSMNSEPDFQSLEKLFHTMTWLMLAFSPLYALFQGVLLTFMQSVWTLTYMRLTNPQDNAPVLLEAHA